MARPGLTTHRKFRRLSRALGSPILARGALELMWESAYECGDDYVGTADDIEALVGWSGEAGKLAAALVDAGAPEGYGFIEPVQVDNSTVTRYRIHDLWHHAPDYVAKRRHRELQRLQKVAPSSKRRRSAPNGRQCSTSSDRQIRSGDTPSPSPSPSPPPSPGEKSVSSAPHAATEPAALTFPVVGSQGSIWRLTDGQVAEWRGLFPNVDVLAECRKALAWVQAHHDRRKTAKGMTRFLVGWLTRAVDARRGPTALTPITKTSGNLAAATRWLERGQG